MNATATHVTRSIDQLARSLGRTAGEVSKAARDHLGLSPSDSRNVNYLLSPHQCAQLREHLGAPARPGPPPAAVPPDSSPEPATPPVDTLPDPPAESGALRFGTPNHGLWVHPDVSDALDGHAHLRKRLGIVLHHLAAHGRTSVVKGCTDEENRGWLRSPLGGNQGMQYYLWWAPQGSRPVKDLEPGRGDIVVRGVRHHDDHSPASAGRLGDYLFLGPQEIEDEAIIGRPWTEEQIQFIDAEDPVRILVGRPGSGKTTALWKAVDARSNQKVLYLTWSRELTRCAEEHFTAFAPVDARVEARDFTTLLGELCQADIGRSTLAASQAAFQGAIARLGPAALGPWAGREKALHAEIRAFLIGRAVPGEPDTLSTDGHAHLTDEAYLAQRRGEIGAPAAEALLRVFHTVEHDALGRIFPELVASARAIERLQGGHPPEGFSAFDRIVVDEAQDLTLLETSVVVELCRACARRRGHAPWLLVAGDDGQTVRPSGFDWGMVGHLLGRRLAKPRRFLLEDNLRCPTAIAEVIERASARYADLEKHIRPTKRRRGAGGQHLDARLFHVEVQHRADAIRLLEDLETHDGTIVMVPQDEIPPWVPERFRDAMFTPAQAKGLEYQSVCLLDPGRLLRRLERPQGDARWEELEKHERRTIIDQLRVALSRATETLALIDVEASPAELALSGDLLGQAVPFDPQDLADHFIHADVLPEERILARTKEARTLLDERPGRAWKCAHQAVRLLGNPALPNGVADANVCREARKTLLHVAARLLVDGVPAGVSRPEVVTAGRVALKALDSGSRASTAFDRLESWCSHRGTADPFALFEAALHLGPDEDWLREALVSVLQELRTATERGASRSPSAGAFHGNVEGWLRLTRFAGDVEAEATRLRCVAFDTLLEAGNLHSAEGVLKRLKTADPYRMGRLREAQGKFKEAAEQFERASAPQDALRNWRAIGQWERACPLAEKDTPERKDLEWLVRLQALLERRPDELAGRLTPEEAARFDKMLEKARAAGSRRRRPQA